MPSRFLLENGLESHSFKSSGPKNALANRFLILPKNYYARLAWIEQWFELIPSRKRGLLGVADAKATQPHVNDHLAHKWPSGESQTCHRPTPFFCDVITCQATGENMNLFQPTWYDARNDNAAMPILHGFTAVDVLPLLYIILRIAASDQRRRKLCKLEDACTASLSGSRGMTESRGSCL